jgi:hypothetical protein
MARRRVTFCTKVCAASAGSRVGFVVITHVAPVTHASRMRGRSAWEKNRPPNGPRPWRAVRS